MQWGNGRRLRVFRGRDVSTGRSRSREVIRWSCVDNELLAKVGWWGIWTGKLCAFRGTKNASVTPLMNFMDTFVYF